MKSTIKTFVNAMAHVLWPRTCEVCGTTLVDGERSLCLGCRLDIPETHNYKDDFNDIHKRIASPSLPIERAAALFHYSPRSKYARLLINAKYNNRPWIDRDLAHTFATKLISEKWFDGIDRIVAVPMHPWKQLRRGYNQAEVIAQQISELTGIEMCYNLRCVSRHGSQTHLNRMARWQNASNRYIVDDPDELQGLHILVVDDIITTGATIMACCTALKTACATVKLSVLSLGLTLSR